MAAQSSQTAQPVGPPVAVSVGPSLGGVVREVLGVDVGVLVLVGLYVGPVWVGDGSFEGGLFVGVPLLPGGREWHAGSVVPGGHFGGSVLLGGVVGGVVVELGGGVLVVDVGGGCVDVEVGVPGVVVCDGQTFG